VGKAKTLPSAPHTVLGWEFENISSAVSELVVKGVTFERYISMKCDEQGIFAFPNGDKVAWFEDPEGKVLSISQQVIGIKDVAPVDSRAPPHVRKIAIALRAPDRRSQ
jgi:hypothetical protein